MLSGLFAVEFIANNQMYGGGIVVIADGAVNGGDLSYLYQGHFDYYGENIKATIDVRHYRGERLSVMGPLGNFSLVLSGTFAGDSFSVDGGIPNLPNPKIRITGKRVADLHA